MHITPMLLPLCALLVHVAHGQAIDLGLVELGCYGDHNERVLSGKSTSCESMTAKMCHDFCAGSSYFGTQGGNKCFCSKSSDNPTSLGLATCDKACSGDASETCGGAHANNLYRYGTSMNPCLDPNDDAYKCGRANSEVQLIACGLVDADAPALAACFDAVGRSSITLVALDDNYLTNLPEDIFEGMPAVVDLSLYVNEFATLPEGLFKGLTSMEQLLLDQNRITSLPEGVFQGLSSLQMIYLADNLLTTLPSGIFQGLPSLKWLFLQNNRLRTLPEGVFKGVGMQELCLRVDRHGVKIDNDDLQCVPANSAPYVLDNGIPDGPCGCDPVEDITCEEGQTCHLGMDGYTCGQPKSKQPTEIDPDPTTPTGEVV